MNNAETTIAAIFRIVLPKLVAGLTSRPLPQARHVARSTARNDQRPRSSV